MTEHDTDALAIEDAIRELDAAGFNGKPTIDKAIAHGGCCAITYATSANDLPQSIMPAPFSYRALADCPAARGWPVRPA